MKKPHIGFIGQGFIGKNYADDFERRGFSVTRYAMEEPYRQNKETIQKCDIVFIAVPTPTTPKGFDLSIVRAVLPLIGKKKTAVIKSTVLPGTTEKLAQEFPDILVMHSPEFLTEATAAHDAAHPNRNIIGIPKKSKVYRAQAQAVIDILPRATYESICSATEAELIKYGGNNWFYFKIIYINLLYDVSQKLGCDWDTIRDALSADPRVGKSHLMPVHKSGTIGSDNFDLIKRKKGSSGGRGAGGHCFIKDFASFVTLYEKLLGDSTGRSVLNALAKKNSELLHASGKDIDLLEGVYGK